MKIKLAKNITRRLRISIFLLVCILISGYLYRSSFTAYFFQDDWFSFRISEVRSIADIASFFIPRTDIIYYRPLGMQFPFFVLKSFFGLNPFPYHLLTFLTHALNIVFVFMLVRMLTKNLRVGMLTALCYAVSTVHYIPFFWFATYAFVFGPTTFFLSFISYLLFLENKRRFFYLISLVTFVVGMLTNEMVITLPFILIVYLAISEKIGLWRNLILYILIGAILFLCRIFLFSPPFSSDYQVGIGKHVLSNLEAYLLWSFSWPEEMKAQLVSFFQVNSQFIKDFPLYFFIFIFTLIFNILICILFPFLLLFSKIYKNLLILSLFCSGWFVLGLSPVLLFSQHAFSYYLPISLVGFFIFLVSVFNYLLIFLCKNSKRLYYTIIFAFILSWLLVSVTAIDFNSKIHWAPRRADLSKNLTNKAVAAYLFTREKKVIYVPASSENKLALNDQDGLVVFLKDRKIITIYSGSGVTQ